MRHTDESHVTAYRRYTKARSEVGASFKGVGAAGVGRQERPVAGCEGARVSERERESESEREIERARERECVCVCVLRGGLGGGCFTKSGRACTRVGTEPGRASVQAAQGARTDEKCGVRKIACHGVSPAYKATNSSGRNWGKTIRAFPGTKPTGITCKTCGVFSSCVGIEWIGSPCGLDGALARLALCCSPAGLI